MDLTFGMCNVLHVFIAYGILVGMTTVLLLELNGGLHLHFSHNGPTNSVHYSS